MTSNKTLAAISLMPQKGEPCEYLLLMLHGWGANYQDLAPLAQMLNLPGFGYLFPNAPFDHYQVPGGKAWYDLENFPNSQLLSQSQELLLNWLTSLPSQTGVPLERTIMAGFSQGGAMTLDVGLGLPLAGLCSLSGYLHYEPQPLETTPPVLIIHGRQDPVVPLASAQQAKEKLTAIGVNVEYQDFDMAHEIQPPALELLQDYIKRIIVNS
ncbi:MAG: dienelactone hydrolase family protein [Xenococcaceae cyanobacterium MO_167.B27]|nr:dienelactone hydrolase family protein [Xenococcaceae cyanobacterium MO_167.B27]